MVIWYLSMTVVDLAYAYQIRCTLSVSSSSRNSRWLPSAVLDLLGAVMWSPTWKSCHDQLYSFQIIRFDFLFSKLESVIHAPKFQFWGFNPKIFWTVVRAPKDTSLPEMTHRDRTQGTTCARGKVYKKEKKTPKLRHIWCLPRPATLLYWNWIWYAKYYSERSSSIPFFSTKSGKGFRSPKVSKIEFSPIQSND